MQAYLTMLQYVIQVQRYQNSRLIPPTVASKLIMQARDTTRAMF